jgi:Na+/H+ antiporter NhaC
VHVALLAGIWLGATLLAGGLLAGLVGTAAALLRVLTDAGSARLLLFSLLIGPLVQGLEEYRGVDGFVAWLARRRLAAGPRGARLMAWLLGVAIFIETNITLLVTGAVCRPLFDRSGESRAKLAYIADSTSAPVCILIPFNAWGALILGLLEAQRVADPLGVFIGAMPLNFYAIAAVLLAGWSAWSGWEIGAMRGAAARQALQAGVVATAAASGQPAIPARALNMLLPLAALIFTMPVALWVSGGGDLAAGSGSGSALAAVLAGNGVLVLLILGQGLSGLGGLARTGLRGLRSLLGLVVILLLAMTLGEVCSRLGTGAYAASWLAGVTWPALLLPLTFVTAAAVAFATGTSWGTFAIILPIAVPAAAALGLPVAPFVAAALSGGIFGDHASPISDTTVVASLAAGSDVIEHVRTQLPYALLAGALAVVLFAVTGAML